MIVQDVAAPAVQPEKGWKKVPELSPDTSSLLTDQMWPGACAAPVRPPAASTIIKVFAHVMSHIQHSFPGKRAAHPSRPLKPSGHSIVLRHALSHAARSGQRLR
ncbi:MAG: hypothetical protein LW703_12220 [Rhodobacter sp.]|nr:hypothetical protein [Rhodobacter sp.]